VVGYVIDVVYLFDVGVVCCFEFVVECWLFDEWV